MTRLSGYQPQYFPRLHYIARLLDSDIFTISDNVQFVRSHLYPTPDGTRKRGKSYQTDTPIKTSHGIYNLTVSIRHKKQGQKLISQTEVAYEKGWAHKHLSTIAVTYGRAKNFSRLFPQVKALLELHYDSLAQLNTATLFWALALILGYGQEAVEPRKLADINDILARPHIFRLRQIVLKSEVDQYLERPAQDATEAIIGRCKALKADEYYVGGTAMQAYIDEKRFRAANIQLIEQDWRCQAYTQQFPKLGFTPNLSIIDLLMNEDLGTVQSVLRGQEIYHRVG